MVDEAYDVLSTLDGSHEQLVDYHKIMANLYLRKQHTDEAVGELKKALGFKKRVVVPYQCTQCHHELAEWSGRCRRCGRWNTYVALPWRAAKSDTDQDDQNSRLPAVPYQGIASPFETV
jgi:lipopolysaccharide biosynthesis regulator YciM